ncbi:MAG: hypothetical protein ACTHMM_05855 [Agriterribacter sp.]
MKLTAKNTLIIAGAMMLAFTAFAINTYAQKTDKTFSFGFGLETGLPLGDYKQLYSFAPGLTLRASYKLGPGFATLTSGALAFLPKSLDGEDLKAGVQIPVKAGYKFIYKEHLFAMGEIGFSRFNYYYTDFDGKVASTKETGATFAPTIGYQTGAFEIGLRYELTGFKGSSLNAMLLRLGFNF